MPFQVLSKIYNRKKLVYYDKVYFGSNSVLKIDPKEGKPNKVDTVDDLLAVVYANFLDIITPPGILTHYVAEDYSFIVVKRPTYERIWGKTKILLKLVDNLRIPNSLKQKLKDFIIDLTELSVKRRYNEVRYLLEKLASQTDTYDLYEYVRRKIESIKRKPYVWLENLGLKD